MMKWKTLLVLHAALALGPALAFAEDDVPKVPAPKPETCEPSFVARRRTDAWYKAHDFKDPKGCTPVTQTVDATVSIPIYWVVASTSSANWTEAEAQALVDKAKTWFARYCITLEPQKVVLKKGESDWLGKKLDAANAVSRNAYDKEVRSLYGSLWKDRMWMPRDFLLVMFVDPYSEVVFDSAVVNVSGNFEKLPVILVTAADKTSDQIVTHELVHGLGKEITAAAPPNSFPYVGDSGNIDNTWHEGGCGDEMGNAARTKPTVPMNKAADAPMDWASYFEYLKLSKNIQ